MIATRLAEQKSKEHTIMNDDVRNIKETLKRVYSPLFKRVYFDTVLRHADYSTTRITRIEGNLLAVWKLVADEMNFNEILGNELYDKIVETSQNIDPDGNMTVKFKLRYETIYHSVSFNLIEDIPSWN